MSSQRFETQLYHLCLVILLLKISEAMFTFQCPVQSHWKHRSEVICDSFDKYFCLYDRNEKKYNESCRDRPDVEKPGYKLIVAGSLQGYPCDHEFYQPFKFSSIGHSRCVYKQSYCSEEGQVVYRNGTEKTVKSCRCDYTRGFDFITRPNNPCLCVPSSEDCSCYHKTCPTKYILSPDYECLKENEWKLNFHCDAIATVVLSKDSGISLSTDNLSFGYHVKAYGMSAFVPVLVMFVIMLSVLVFLLKLPVLLGCFNRMKQKRTDTNIAMEKNCREENIVPSQIKEFQDETLQDWKRKLNKIVPTRATEFIYHKLLKKNIIVIAGPTGSGKSAIAYYAAFKLQKMYGYTIIPARQSEDITNYHVPGTKQMFIVDDFIGKYTINETDVYLWEKHWPLLKIIFGNKDDTKIILTSRTYIWQPERYACLSLDAFTCDLLSKDICLLPKERWNICRSYLEEDIINALEEKTILMYSFFPSLCSSFTPSKHIQVECFFEAPYQIIDEEINNFKIKSQISFIALAILAINQTISHIEFSIDNHAYNDLFQDVFHESAFLQYPSKNLLKSSLVALTGTYVKHVVENDTGYFMFLHDTLENIVLRCISKTLIRSVIKYCKFKVILNQLRLNYFYTKSDVFTIDVAAENEDAYFRRIVNELNKGWNYAIFKNEQNNNRQFRVRFLKYLKKYLPHDNRTKHQDDMPVLHVVSDLGYQDYTSYFIHDNCMINQKDSAGNIPLHLACMKGHTEIVLNLVERKSIINIANNEGMKPFVYACENNFKTVAKLLLHHCAKWINVNEKYQKRNKRSALHIVSSKGFADIVLLLLENNADVNMQDGSECTPLHIASDSAVVKALLAFNANINAVDAYGRSPVYFACGAKNERVLQLLIENKADINQKTVNGFQPIHAACQSGSIEIVKTLLEKDAKINCAKPGISPLHEACKIGNESIVNSLIESNASVNHKTKDGLTPLHEACKNQHVNVVKILLDNKANVNEAIIYGWTALFFSCFNGCRTIVDLLLQHGANLNIWDEDKVSPLMLACKEEYMDVVDLLLSSNANVNYCDKDNCSSLLVACENANTDLVNLLLKYSADINLADKNMITPLHAACMNNNNIKLVLKLVESNANVNAADKNGQTPLFKSIFNGYSEIVDILLRHGSSVNLRDKFGNSPLAIAEIKGHTTIVHVLRQFKHDNQIV